MSASSGFTQEYNLEEAMRLASPNENHQRLETDFGGSWTYDMITNMEGRKLSGVGSSNNNMILGGRFMLFNAEGTMLGMNVKSITIIGYDNALEKYTMIGMDELGTYYITAEGTYDVLTKTYTLDGSYVEPVLKRQQNYKFVFEVSDASHPVGKVLFENEQGGWDEIMTMTYTRN